MNDSTISKRTEWWLILAVGCLWGLTESAGRTVLHHAGIAQHNGSMLAGFAVLFFASAYALAPRWWVFVALPLLAGVFKVYIAGLQHQPILCRGMANNVLYAYFTEALVFGGVVYLARSAHRTSWLGGGILGATSAVIAANAFILAPVVTGVSACVVPGTGFPASIAGLPYGMAIAALAAPVGFGVGGRVLQHFGTAPEKRPLVAWPVGASVATACVLTVTLMYVL
jgi:hypothetical protein